MVKISDHSEKEIKSVETVKLLFTKKHAVKAVS